MNLLQLNQQQNHSKGAKTQDYSFLKEASPIYVTSLTGNHVSGTTTVTGTISNLPGSNCISTPSSATTATSLLHNNNLQHTSTTATPSINVVSTHQVHVHQPPASSASISSVNKLTTNIQVNPTPLAGGWLIGESAQGTLITTNNQQIFQNLNSINNNNSNSSTALANTINNGNSNNNLLSGSAINNNNSNINNSSVKTNSASVATGAAGTQSAVAAAAASASIASLTTTTDGNNLTNYYGNTSSSSTSTSCSELLANGHGPRREVSFFIHLSSSLSLYLCISVLLAKKL